MPDKVTITLALPEALSEWVASGSKKKSIKPEDFIVSALAEVSVQEDEERKSKSLHGLSITNHLPEIS